MELNTIYIHLLPTLLLPMMKYSFLQQFIISEENIWLVIWAASSKFGTYRLCEQRRFRRACTYAQSRQNLRCSLIQAVSQEVPSDRKPDPWPLWMAGHAQLKFVMTECSKTQIRLTRPIWSRQHVRVEVLVYITFFVYKRLYKVTMTL